MATEKRLIDINKVIDQMQKCIDESPYTRDAIASYTFGAIIKCLKKEPTVDAVEVVRCEKCVHCVDDEEEPGMCKCVESAEYDSKSGIWLGFVEYHTPDFFCAYGERKDND
jgi:hypothetical protein